jgi:outer membrane protein W
MNRSIVLVLGLSILFVVSAPFASFAQDKPSAYITIKPGAYFPTGDLDDKGFVSMFDGSVAIGTYYLPNLALEAEVGYFQTRASSQTADSNETDKLWVLPVTVTFKGVLPMKGFELTAGGGGGVYFANLTADKSTASGSSSDDGHATALGAHVQAGVNVDVAPKMFVGAEGKYIFTTSEHLLGAKVNLDGFMVTGVVGYRF